MHPVFKKLQFRDHDRILVLDSPDEFAEPLEQVSRETQVITNLRGRRAVGFALVFVREAADIARRTPSVTALLEDDGLLWFAYPKKSSKRYTTDLARDHGWQPLGDAGFEGVRQVAIDDDWSALRFRRAEHIRSLKRAPQRAMSKEGRKRTGRSRSP